MALGPIELIVILLPLLAVGLLVGVAWWGGPNRDRFVSEWAAAHALTLTPGNIGFVRHYLTTGRRLRVVCVIAGVVVPPLARTAIEPGRQSGWSISLMGVLGGYLVGTLWAELALTRPSSGGPRMASLAPRRVEDYLAPVLRHGPRVIALLTTLAWVAVIFTRQSPAPGQVTNLVSTTTMDAWAALAVLTASGIEAVQRWVLRRPQPMVAPDLLAADDAVRSQSLHLLAGTGAALMLCWLIAPLWIIGQQTSGVPAAVAHVAGLVSFLAALFFWRYYGNRAWRVRRPEVVSPVLATR